MQRRLERAPGRGPQHRQGGGRIARPPSAPRGAHPRLLSRVRPDAGGPDRRHGRGPRGAACAWRAALRADELVARDVPPRPPPLPLLERFRGIVVSGELGVMKPDARIFHHLTETHALDAKDCLFIDDSLKNVAGARAAGLQALALHRAGRLARVLAPVRIAMEPAFCTSTIDSPPGRG